MVHELRDAGVEHVGGQSWWLMVFDSLALLFPNRSVMSCLQCIICFSSLLQLSCMRSPSVPLLQADDDHGDVRVIISTSRYALFPTYDIPLTPHALLLVRASGVHEAGLDDYLR